VEWTGCQSVAERFGVVLLFVQAPRLHSDEYTEKHVVKCNVYVGHIREEYYGRVCLRMCLTLGKYKKNGRFPHPV
jgi:hypothetical protein